VSHRERRTSVVSPLIIIAGSCVTM
jgi:hypothetical protein